MQHVTSGQVLLASRTEVSYSDIGNFGIRPHFCHQFNFNPYRLVLDKISPKSSNFGPIQSFPSTLHYLLINLYMCQGLKL